MSEVRPKTAKPQSFETHARLSPQYHFALLPVLTLGLIGSLVNLYLSIGDHQRLYSAALITLLTFCVIWMGLTARVFALRAQDRAIRAEENLRHFALTGALLDPRLTMAQVIGLRFASDAEFVALARRAADEGLSQADIKKAVTEWRPDWHRV